MLLKLAPALVTWLVVAFGADRVGAGPSTTPSLAVNRPTLARRLADATPKIKAARAAMEAAKIEAIRRFDATGAGRELVLDLAEKAAAADNADVLGGQSRIDVRAAYFQARSKLEGAHLKVIETDSGVEAATAAIAAAHAEREALRREMDSMLASN
jgi:hypothetical protein